MLHENLGTSQYDWPDVFAFADYLCVHFECKQIVVLGSSAGHVLSPLAANYPIHGLERKENIENCSALYPFVAWQIHQLDSLKPIPIPNQILKESIVICLDDRGDLRRPGGVLRCLGKIMDISPVCLLVTTLNERMSEVSEWNRMLKSEKLHVEFSGLTVNSKTDFRKNTLLSVVSNNQLKRKRSKPLKIAAIITAYNEEDIIYHCIKRLLDQNISVYVIENWSTDSTIEIINSLQAHPGFLGCERFPLEGPGNYFNWQGMLDRVAEITQQLDADWYIHHDADEIRQSPWPDKNLNEAITYVDQMGYNAINHTLIEFFPTDNGYSQLVDYEDYFRYFEYGKLESDFIQIKAWKRTAEQVNLSDFGGHQAVFQGRRICPYKFTSKHYPYRSQQHAEKKIFRDRKSRYAPEELAQGFHTHYDNYNQGHLFIRDPAELIEFHNRSYHTVNLVERLSGIGTNRVKDTIAPVDDTIDAENLMQTGNKKSKRVTKSRRKKARLAKRSRIVLKSARRNTIKIEKKKGLAERRKQKKPIRQKRRKENSIVKKRTKRVSR
ncbi:glycosyltransferase family A protein [Cohnella abietis]|uniref:Glycosyltransferase 2-like domain-containing protein n=1 Tax=Cohnella abietis TaxID=2507935 RepID=A0A3T1D7G8_9BACL|nr:glycosyltransferase family A protein [Cohnella abietis]BBI34037.1 hypothetical protein KCTCHS21_34360 [Cohnella abietis]